MEEVEYGRKEWDGEKKVHRGDREREIYSCIREMREYKREVGIFLWLFKSSLRPKDRSMAFQNELQHNQSGGTLLVCGAI